MSLHRYKKAVRAQHRHPVPHTVEHRPPSTYTRTELVLMWIPVVILLIALLSEPWM